LFLAGQVAKDREGRVVGKGDLVAQFRQVCENLRTLVAAGGGRLTDVVKLTIYVLDAGDSEAMADAIRRIREDPALRRRMIAAGRRRAAGFTWRRCAEGVADAVRARLSLRAPATSGRQPEPS